MECKEIERQWWNDATVAVTTYQCGEHVVTVSTVDLADRPLDPIEEMYCEMVEAFTDLVEGPVSGDYETMLFIDSESADYPFGNLPGDESRGCFRRYESMEGALVGHALFCEQVKAILAEKESLDA